MILRGVSDIIEDLSVCTYSDKIFSSLCFTIRDYDANSGKSSSYTKKDGLEIGPRYGARSAH